MDPINPVAGNPEALNQNPQTPVMPKDNHGITIAAMAIFVLLALGAVAFLYFQNQQLKNLLASYQTPKASPSPMATVDPTAGWKVYTSKDGSFSFKYPQDSIFKADSLNIDGSVVFSNFILSREKTNDTLSDYVTAHEDKNLLPVPTAKVVGNLSTIEWVGFYKNAPTFYVSILNNGYVYSIGLTPYDSATNDTNQTISLFDQILSTFKFLTATSSPSAGLSCTYNSKTYKNGEGFKASDGCNSCSCVNGQIACTLMACSQ